MDSLQTKHHHGQAMIFTFKAKHIGMIITSSISFFGLDGKAFFKMGPNHSGRIKQFQTIWVILRDSLCNNALFALLDGKGICFFLYLFSPWPIRYLKSWRSLCKQFMCFMGKKGLHGNIVFAMLGLWYSYLGLSFFFNIWREGFKQWYVCNFSNFSMVHVWYM